MTGGDYLEGVIAGTNIGRDSDTIANLVGGLAGALHGAQAIPEDWVEGVEEISPALMARFRQLSTDLATYLKKRADGHARVAEETSALLSE
jgi:ADP-ribosylglycohydrolase